MTGPRAERRPYLRRFLPTVGRGTRRGSSRRSAVSTARGDGPLGWLGARSGTFDVVHPGEIPKWFAYLVADLVLYVAVVPVVATAVVVGLGLSRRAPEAQRLFASVALPTAVAMLGERLARQRDLRRRRRREHQRAVRVRARAAPVRRAGALDRVRAAAPDGRGPGRPLRSRCVLPVIVPIARLRATRPSSSRSRSSRGRASTRQRAGPRRLRCRLHRSPAASCGRRSGARASGAPGCWRPRRWSSSARSRPSRTRSSATNSATPVSVGRATWVDDAVPAGARRRRPVGRAPGARGVARSLLPVADGDRALQLERSATSTGSGRRRTTRTGCRPSRSSSGGDGSLELAGGGRPTRRTTC